MSNANAYSPTHRGWNHVGNLFPNVEHAEKEHGRLAGDFIPAPWLPVQLYDVHFEAWSVISPGKIVALTTQAEEIKSSIGDYEDSSHVVPAGLKLAWAGGGDVLTYTADDVTQRVIDLTTGVPVTAAAGYTAAEITTALKARGLIEDSETCVDFISYPVGVAAMACWKWAALDGSKFHPASLANHNFRLQHQVQILTSYQLRLPWIPVAESNKTVPAALTGTALVFGSGDMFAASDVTSLVRYSALTGSSFVALALENFPVAGPTDLVAFTPTVAGVTMRLRSGPNALIAAGDYWLDREVGVVFFYAADGGTGGVPAWLDGGTSTVAYSSYMGAGTATDYASVVSGASAAVKNGDFLVCDADSNFALDTGPTAYSAYRVGQVFGFKTYPKDLVHRVKSQYTNLGVLNKMAGTATGGLPETLTYTSAADKEVLVNLINR